MKWDLSKASIGGKSVTQGEPQWDLSKASVSSQKSSEYTKLYQQVGFDTLESDLKTVADAVNNAYNGWQDADTMKKTKKQIVNMQKRLKAYSQFKSQYAPNATDLSEVAKAYSDVSTNVANYSDEYAKYENKKDYDEAVKNFETYQASLTVDLGILDAEIDKLKQMRNTANSLEDDVETIQNKINQSNKYSGRNGWVYGEEARNNDNAQLAAAKEKLNKYLEQNGYKNVEELRTAVAEKKQYSNIAKINQSLAKISEPVINAEDFESKSVYIPVKRVTDELDQLYYTMNTVSTEDIPGSEYSRLPIFDEEGNIDRHEINYYNQLSDSEKKIFNYLYNAGKKQEAKEYLGKLHTTLENRAANKFFEENLEGKPFLETLYGIPVGFDQFGQGISNLFNTEDDYIEPSYTQKVGSMISEDLEGGWKFAYDATTTLSNMAPSILLSYMTGGVASGLGASAKVAGTVSKATGALSMGGSASGNAYAQALNMGYDKSQARVYSALVGGSEALLSYAFSGISKLGGTVTQKSISTIVSGIDNGFLRFAANFGLKAGSEAIEEMTQEILEPLFENIALGYGKNGFDDIDWDQVVYSGLMALVSTGILEGVPTIRETRAQSKKIQNVKKTYGNQTALNALVEEGLAMPENSKAVELAQELKQKIENNKKVKGVEVSALVDANEAAIRDGDVTKINNAVTKRLTELGEKTNVGIIANAITKKAIGESLTLFEKNAISNSEYGTRVANEVNANNINAGDYSSYWAEIIETERINAQEYGKSVDGDTNENNLSKIENKLFNTDDADLTPAERSMKQRLFTRRVNQQGFVFAANNPSVQNEGIKNTAKNSGGVNSENIIDLSSDNELSKQLGDLHGAEKYKKIKEYILGLLGGKSIKLSDGKNAVVDGRDAKHIASNAGNKKIAQISQLKKIIEVAKPVAEENSTKEKKFEYFYYYETFVSDGKETYPVYVNVGKARNDGSYHIYDITQKIRDTAHRVNDVGRPVGNALENGISNNNIPQGENVVNNNSMQETENYSNTQGEDGGIGLSNPADKDIYRAPTSEEQIAELTTGQKTVQQRHILDVAKKLDKNLRVAYVDNDAELLHGKNGKYVRDTNTIYLAKDLFTLEMYVEVFKHEFVHRLESKKAYQSFKDYLFNKSKLFGDYAIARLTVEGTKFERTREDAIKQLTDLYYDNFVNDKTIPQAIKEKFTKEKAEREIVADFVGRVLFKGKNNTADITQMIADSELIKATKIESDVAFFEEIAKDDRSLLQKIIDAIKDFIANLKGLKQNQRLVNDLEYIEQRLSRVYNSKDTKKAAQKAANEQFDIAVLENGNTYVKASRKVINGTTLKEQRSDITNFFKKLLKNKPSIDIHTIEGDILTITMKDTADKARDNYKVVSGKRVKLSEGEFAVKLRVESHIDEIAETSISNKRPLTNDEKSHDIAKDGFEYRTAYFEDFDGQYYQVRFSVGHNGTVATIYNIGKIKESVPSSAKLIAVVGSQALDESLSNDIIDKKSPTVNTILSEDGESYSSDSAFDKARELLTKYEQGEISRNEYLAEMDGLYGQAIDKYSSIPEGENANAPISTPKAVADNKPTERFIRTVIETGKLTDEMIDSVEERVLLGDFGYKVMSDKKATQKADAAVKNGTAADVWEDVVNNGKRVNKNQIAVGERLLADAIEAGDTAKVLQISSELADIFTRAGQVVQAASLLKKMTGTGRLLTAQRMVKTINNDLRQKYGEDRTPVKISEATAKRLVNAKTQKGIEHAYQEVLQEVADQMPVTFLDKWNAWRYFAMLSNPKTHIRNVVGNLIFVPAVRIKDTIAAITEATFIDSSKRTKSLVIKKEYADFAKKDGKRDEVKELLKGNKYNDKTDLRDKQQIFKTKALEFLTTFNSNALEAEDALFKNKHYVHALAGFLQARKVNLTNVSEDVLTEARIYAVNEARKATFNDESALANWVQNFGRKNIATNIAVEGVLPFKRTPINIVKRGVEYSPLGLGKTLTKGVYDVVKGKITATEFIDGLASGLTGTGITLVGMFLANLGCVSSGDDDEKESAFEKLLGKQEYAIEFFGKSYTIDWGAPACISFFIGVELIETMKEGEEFNFADIGNLAWNILEPITNLSMLSGIQGVIESARYADSTQVLSSIASDALTSYAMQGIPSIFGAISRTIDPTQRSWYTDKNSKWFDSFSQSVINNVKSKIPGLSYTQIPKIDAWGREVSRGELGERVFENFISPGYYSELEYDDTSEELKRLYKETDENVFPTTAAKSFEVNGERKYLTAEEYVTYAKAKGEYSFDYIYDFINSDEYKKLNDGQRAKVISSLYEYANAKAKTLVSDYDLMGDNSRYKTVTRWEKNGISAVEYYTSQAKK